MLNPKLFLLFLVFFFVFCKENSNLISNTEKTNVIEYQKYDYETIEKDSLKVIGISDGDSFKVLFKNQELKIRIHGIDAPERNMPFYLTSKKYLSHLIFNDYVFIKIRTKDQYYRYIAEVFLPNKQNIGQEMVKNGYAWHFVKYSKDEQLAKNQIFAKKNKLGLWYDENPTPPWEYRKMKKAENAN